MFYLDCFYVMNDWIFFKSEIDKQFCREKLYEFKVKVEIRNKGLSIFPGGIKLHLKLLSLSSKIETVIIQNDEINYEKSFFCSNVFFSNSFF